MNRAGIRAAGQEIKVSVARSDLSSEQDIEQSRNKFQENSQAV